MFECNGTLEGHENEVKTVAWFPPGSLMATCGKDKSVCVCCRFGLLPLCCLKYDISVLFNIERTSSPDVECVWEEAFLLNYLTTVCKRQSVGFPVW